MENSKQEIGTALSSERRRNTSRSELSNNRRDHESKIERCAWFTNFPVAEHSESGGGFGYLLPSCAGVTPGAYQHEVKRKENKFQVSAVSTKRLTTSCCESKESMQPRAPDVQSLMPASNKLSVYQAALYTQMHDSQSSRKPGRHISSSGKTSALAPLESLYHEVVLSEYQTALYEQNHGPQPSRRPGHQHQQIVMFSEEDPVVSLHPKQGAKYPPRSPFPGSSFQDRDLPEVVEGEALLGLSVSELIGQCLVRDRLVRLSELHEKEMGEALTKAEDKLKDEGNAYERLLEENRRLWEENRLFLQQLDSKFKQRNLELSQLSRQQVSQQPEDIKRETTTVLMQSRVALKSAPYPHIDETESTTLRKGGHHYGSAVDNPSAGVGEMTASMRQERYEYLHGSSVDNLPMSLEGKGKETVVPTSHREKHTERFAERFAGTESMVNEPLGVNNRKTERREQTAEGVAENSNPCADLQLQATNEKIRQLELELKVFKEEHAVLIAQLQSKLSEKNRTISDLRSRLQRGEVESEWRAIQTAKLEDSPLQTNPGRLLSSLDSSSPVSEDESKAQQHQVSDLAQTDRNQHCSRKKSAAND